MPQPQQLVRLVGIARLASEGVIVAEKQRVEYRSLPTRKWLNRCHSQRVPFHWTVNPYRGCEYGCKYCYARFTHELMERHDPASFETEIYAKDWDQAALEQELRAVKPGQVIGIGTGTDPYQPAERRFGRTRQVLQAMLPLSGASIFITTKSDLVSRDADILKELSVRNRVGVTLSVTTMNRSLARLLEPYAPRPDLRMQAVAALSETGVSAGVIASPVLPLLTDSERSLEAVAKAAHASGASQFGANVVFLKPAAQRVFFPFLADHFPQYLRKYENAFRSGAYLHGAYPERIRQLVSDIRARVGIPARDLAPVSPPVPDAQMLLF